MSTSLIPFDQTKAIELFKNPKDMQGVLDEIEKQAKDFDPDPTTAAGRKKIGSQAAMVSSSKVVIDKAKKVLTSDWAKKKKEVDALGKMAIDFCDRVRDEILDTRVQWQAETQRKAVAKLRALELFEAESEAYAENEIFDREQALKEKEAVMAWVEAEADRIDAEKIAAEFEANRLEQIRIEAQERAKREAAEAIEREKKRADQAERDKVEAEEKAEQERLDNLECIRLQAEQAQREKVEAQERADQEATEAAERAGREKAEAVERERHRAEEQRAEERREAAARAADRENRRKVNSKIVDAFKAESIGEKTAQNIVRLVASGGIPHMTIGY